MSYRLGSIFMCVVLCGCAVRPKGHLEQADVDKSEFARMRSSLRYALRADGRVRFTVERVVPGPFLYSICLFDGRTYKCEHNVGVGSSWQTDVQEGSAITVYRTTGTQLQDADGRVLGASETFALKPPDWKAWTGDTLVWEQEGFYLALVVEQP
jgi:hypothetical protein